MRWGANDLELLVMNSTEDNLKVEFDVEPGPSIQALPLQIEIINEEDRKIGYIEINTREKVIIDLIIEKDKRYQMLKMKVLNKSKKLEVDPRDLNLRVFSMKVLK